MSVLERARGINWSLGRQAVWNLIDQIISSLGTAASSFLIARSVGADEFGVFGLSFAVLTVLVGVTRSLGSGAYAIKYPLESGRARPQLAGVCFGLTLLVALAAAPLLIGTSLLFDDGHRAALIVFALLLPALLVQDTARTLLLGQGRPRAAAMNDAVTTFVQISAVIMGAISGAHIGGMIALWAAGAVVGSALGFVQLAARPRFSGIRAWMRAVGQVSWPLLGEWLTLVGFGQFSYVGIGAVAGVRTLGAIRGGQTLLGPLGTFGTAVTAFAIPQLASRELSDRATRTFAALTSALLAVVAVTWGVILLLLPDSVGEGLLGDSWNGAQSLLLPLLLGQVAVALTVGPNALLATMSMTSRSFRVAIVQGVLMATLGLSGALLLGARAAVYGLALATLLAVPFAWWQLNIGLRLRREAPEQTGAVTSS